MRTSHIYFLQSFMAVTKKVFFLKGDEKVFFLGMVTKKVG